MSIGYWVEDVRDSDYFTLDDLEKIREVFADEIAYIDSYASVNPDVRVGRTSMKFDLQGVDRDYQEVQPVTMVAGRYLNEYEYHVEVAKERGGEFRKINVEFVIMDAFPAK